MKYLVTLLFLLILFLANVDSQPILDRQFIGPLDKVDTLTYPLNLNNLGITIPRINSDDNIDRKLHDARTIYYKLPQVWQHWIPASKIESKNLALNTTTYTTLPSVWGIYRTSYLHDFNANGDFPWETTIGLNISHREGKNISDTINFISLPEDEDGRLIPILILGYERPIKWLFPAETLIGEIVYTTFQNKKYIQEVRTRLKSNDNLRWSVNVYRPVQDRNEFQRLIQAIYQPSKKYIDLRNPEEDEVMHLAGTIERLPNIDPELVKKLLSRPFKDVSRSNWHPASEQDFHILPKDYTLGLLHSIDSVSCADCHRQTQISVRNLTPTEPKIQNNPLKVGNIRGCDGIFTWHPFDMRSVMKDDSKPVDKTIYVRRFDYNNKITQILDKGQRARYDYKITKYVQDSLKPYELPTDSAFLHNNKRDIESVLWFPLVDNKILLPNELEPEPMKEQPVEKFVFWKTAKEFGIATNNLYLIDRDTGKTIGYYNHDTMEYRSIEKDKISSPSKLPIQLPK